HLGQELLSGLGRELPVLPGRHTARPDMDLRINDQHTLFLSPNVVPAKPGTTTPNQPGSFQPSQSHSPWPITSSRSRPLSHGNSSLNIVTHCRHEHGMRVISVPQKKRCGPKASYSCRTY